MTRTLLAILPLDGECVNACLASVSSRLYQAKANDTCVAAFDEARHSLPSYSTSQLVCANAITTLGRIGIAMNDVVGVPESVLQVRVTIAQRCRDNQRYRSSSNASARRRRRSTRSSCTSSPTWSSPTV